MREVLGDAVDITDDAIRSSLWHYYFDEEQTIAYLLGEHVNAARGHAQAEPCFTPDQREKKAAKKAKTQGRLNFNLLLPSVTHTPASLVDWRVVKNKPQQSIIVSHRG